MLRITEMTADEVMPYVSKLIKENPQAQKVTIPIGVLIHIIISIHDCMEAMCLKKYGRRVNAGELAGSLIVSLYEQAIEIRKMQDKVRSDLGKVKIDEEFKLEPEGEK